MTLPNGAPTKIGNDLLPSVDIEIGHQSTLLCHFANISYMFSSAGRLNGITSSGKSGSCCFTL